MIEERVIHVEGIALRPGLSKNGIMYSEEEIKLTAAELSDKPILKDHISKTDNVIGRTLEASFVVDENGVGLSYSGWVKEDGSQITERISDGRIKEVSIGAMVDKLVKESEDSDFVIAKGIHYMELSTTPTPGVNGTSMKQTLKQMDKFKTESDKRRIQPILESVGDFKVKEKEEDPKEESEVKTEEPKKESETKTEDTEEESKGTEEEIADAEETEETPEKETESEEETEKETKEEKEETVETEETSNTEALWDTKFISELPDEAFAIILPSGKKDDDGKTVLISLRKLPHHGTGVKSGMEHTTVDLPQLKIALARLDQTDLTSTQKTASRTHLEAHAKALKSGAENVELELNENYSEESKMTEEKVVKTETVAENTETETVVETKQEAFDMSKLTESIAQVLEDKIAPLKAELAELKAVKEEAEEKEAEKETKEDEKAEETVTKSVVETAEVGEDFNGYCMEKMANGKYSFWKMPNQSGSY